MVGALAVRRLAFGLAGLAVFGALGVSAALTGPASGASDAVPTLAGVAVAALALTMLVRALLDTGPGTSPGPVPAPSGS